jgi:hypothetical protein
LMQRLSRVRWLVYVKKPFRRVDHVLSYLGRYTHRVAISNSRLVNVTENAVCFRTKNCRAVTVTPVQFLRRFVLHLLPQNFVKIRHYGLLAATNINSKLPIARRVLEHSHAQFATKPAQDTITEQAETEKRLAIPVRIPPYCPLCGAELVTRSLSRPPCRPSMRSPP